MRGRVAERDQIQTRTAESSSQRARPIAAAVLAALRSKRGYAVAVVVATTNGLVAASIFMNSAIPPS